MKPVRMAALAALALTLGPAGLAAQRPASRIGVIGGVNFATLSGDDIENVKTKTAFFGGGFFELALSPNFAIVPEVLYSMKGAKDDSDPGVDATIDLAMIEVPVLFKAMFPSANESGWALRPHMYAGPAIAFKTSCKFSGTEGTVSVDVDCEEFEDVGTISNIDFSAVFGVGVDIGDLTLGARYDLGLVKLSELPDGTKEDVRTRTFSIYAGFGFKLPN